MTPAETVAEALRSTGLPFTHYAYPTGHAPALPWCVWFVDSDDDLYADDQNYAHIDRMTVELYQDEPSDDVASSVRNALRQIGPTSEYSNWLEDEGCLMTTFNFTIISKGDQ